jgi:hypothetical protein
MSTANKKCMVCAETVTALNGGICEACQERIRREAMGEQAREIDSADKELARQGVPPTRRPGK